jgi:IclR family transcriptional regulator, acetate operon repressor
MNRHVIRTCAQIKVQGVVTDEGEYQQGLLGIATPTCDHDGTIIGAIGVSAPATRFPQECYASCAEQAISATRGMYRVISNQTQEASVQSA